MLGISYVREIQFFVLRRSLSIENLYGSHLDVGSWCCFVWCHSFLIFLGHINENLKVKANLAHCVGNGRTERKSSMCIVPCYCCPPGSLAVLLFQRTSNALGQDSHIYFPVKRDKNKWGGEGFICRVCCFSLRRLVDAFGSINRPDLQAVCLQKKSEIIQFPITSVSVDDTVGASIFWM